MHHPVLKTLLARLRAFEAVERASFALATIDALMEPFERHRIRVDMAGDSAILFMGDCIGPLFGQGWEGQPVITLFRYADRGFLQRLLASLMKEELGCHFGATAVTADGVPVAMEGLILPEPPTSPYASVSHVSICLLCSDFPAAPAGDGPLQPMTLGPTRYVSLENRGADRALLFKMRWPKPELWSRRT